METIKGTVKFIAFQSEESGFKVLKIRTSGGPQLTVVGEFGPEMVVNTIAEFHGTYKSHPKYGTNFKISGYHVLHNVEELASIKLFLDTIAPNIGPERASLIVSHFGSDTISILDTSPQRLTEIDGVGKVSATSLAEAWGKNKHKWAEQRHEYTLRAFLNSVGIKERRIKKILSYFGGSLSAEEKIKENPYKLAEIEGFGFSTADSVARQFGMLESDPLRLKAFIFYALSTICPTLGHLYLTLEELVNLINKYGKEKSTSFLGKRIIISTDLEQPIKELSDENTIIREEDTLYFRQSYISESRSAVKITGILNKPSDLIFLTEESTNKHIEDFEHSNNITLSEEQRDALHYFIGKKVFVITGAPGTGKCLGFNTPVLMYDGTIKMVQDIKKGELLMGDDSKPRRVLSTCCGKEEMFEIQPTKGDPYTVNKSHILSLKDSTKGVVNDIPLIEYLGLEEKSYLKGYRTPIDFKTLKVIDTQLTDIQVIPKGIGDYYGFEIDGNGRFLLGDFTVTHNTTVLKAIVDLVLHLKLRLTCLTPTGISAKKMASTIKYDAFTIHRCLGFRGKEWVYGEHNKFETDVVIVDESCLPYKQYINLADGSKKYIGTIVNQKLPVEVLSYNLDKKIIEPKKVINWFKYPYKNPLYKIKLSKAKNRERQRILRCTGNHKIYTKTGVKKAAEIHVGDRVFVKGTFLNSFQKSFLLGAVIGDASISSKSSGKIIKFVQGQDQKKYLFMKAKIFNCHKPYQCKGGYIPEKKLWASFSKTIDDLDEIYEYTYPNGKREITQEWLDQIDEIGMAVWYMDNGSLTSQNGRSFTSKLHTEAFSKKENDMIVSWLRNRWGLNSSVYKNRKYYLIRFTCESAKKFWKIILPWVIPSMAYKFPEGYNPKFKAGKQKYLDVCPYPVQRIERFEPTGNTKRFNYDICVEDNHNYLSNDILVSNSMVDQEVFYRLLSALRDRVHIIFVGDDYQLPSVGAGNVLNQLINCGQVPIVRLEQIFRQEEASDIIKVAHRIKNGDTNLSLFKSDPKSDVFFMRENNLETVENYVIKLAQKFKKDRLFQIITPRNQGPLSVDELNSCLQNILNPAGFETERNLGKYIIRRGDRVIIIKNDYELGVFNGEVGKVTHLGEGFINIKLDEKEIKITNEDAKEKVKLAYALTVHRSQGQEYPFIILPFINQYGRNMLQRNLLYTAITRAQKKVIIIGHGSALEKAINNSSVNKRNTKLGERITRCLALSKKNSSQIQSGEPQDYLGALYNEVPF